MSHTIIGSILAILMLTLGACTQPRPGLAIIEPSYSHLRNGENRVEDGTMVFSQRPSNTMVVRR